MNKFIKCWVFILCILFILLILFTDRVNAETISNIEIYGIDFCSGQNWANQNSKSGGILISNNFSPCNASYPIRVYLSNVGTQLSNKIITFTLQSNGWTSVGSPNHIGPTAVRIRDNSNHIYGCETYTTDNSTMVNVICPYVGQVDNGGASIEFYTTPWSTQNLKISYLNVFNNDSQTLSNIYSTLLQQQTQNNTNTQSIINNQNQNAQQQHQDAQNINNSITSSDVTGNNSSSSITSIGNTFNTQEDFLLNLLTIPYTLWTSILNVFSNSCAPLDVGTMFNYHLVFPCIELNDFLGGIYATIIDVIFTAIIYSAFIRRVIKYFRELLTLDEHALITGGVKLW